MKYLYTLLAFIFICGASLKGQNYTFRYNQYSGMNKAQLELALEQSNKLEQSGKVWTAVGSGMLIAGTIMTFNGIGDMSMEESIDWSTFGVGVGLMCVSAFPLAYGFFAWISGNEQAKMIEIELLSSDFEGLSLKPTKNGIGLVLEF